MIELTESIKYYKDDQTKFSEDTRQEKRVALHDKLRSEDLRRQFMIEQANMLSLLGGLKFNHFMFLVVLGVLTAIAGYGAELAIAEANKCRNDLCK